MKKIILTFLIGPALFLGQLTAQTETKDDEPPDEIDPALVPNQSAQTGAQPVAQQRDLNADPSIEEKISVNFPDTSLSQILLNYERLSGKRLIKDVNLAGQNMSIVVAEPVTKREAITIIEATLLLNNFSLIPFGENQMKVVNIQNGKNPRSEGVAIYTTPNALPEGDQVVSYFMTLKYRDAQQAAQELQQSFAPHQYGVIFPVPNAQAIIVTESTSVIRRLLELKELIDVPPSRIISEFVPLIRADAERVAETITKMIDAQKNNTASNGAAPVANNVPPVPQPNGEVVQNNVAGNNADTSSNSLTAGQIQLTADTRTNRILVICRPTSFPYVKSLIQEFDRSVGLTEPLEMTLRYVKPSEVLQVLSDLLTENEKDATASGGNAIQQPNAPVQNRATGGGNTRNGSNSGSGGSSLTRDDSLEDPTADVGPESRIVGKTRIIADNKAGKILVIGPPESLEKVRGILERLDHKPQQVYLSAVIGQLTITGNQQFGIDYLQSFLGGKGGGIAATGITSTGTSFDSPAALKAVSLLPAVSGLSLYGTIADNLSIYVRALESSNRFKVLSRPAIYASNNEKAVISSGRRIAVPTQTLTNNTLNANNTASVTSNIDYEDVVLKIEIVPQINSNNEVTMQIAQINDTVAGSQTISGQTVPTIATQEIRTTVTVADQNVVVLGGLVTESNTDDRSKIPILGDIPYLGVLFRNTSKNKQRDELLVFIQPNVVSSNADAQRASRSEEIRSEVGVPGRANAEGVPTPTPERFFKIRKKESKPE